MAQVITVVEMMKFEKQEKVVFPLDTILTPSAKDWASEHFIQIVLGKDEQAEVLQLVVESVIKNVRKTGKIPNGDVPEIVSRSLQKLGYKVE